MKTSGLGELHKLMYEHLSNPIVIGNLSSDSRRELHEKISSALEKIELEMETMRRFKNSCMNCKEINDTSRMICIPCWVNGLRPRGSN